MFRLDYKLTGRYAAWVAIMAVVLNALWPLIAQVKPGMAPMQMAQMGQMAQMADCPEGGMHHSDEDGGGTAPAEKSPLMPQCGFCSLAVGGFTALVADRIITTVLLIETKEIRPALPEERPLASFTYSPAHPRGPPVLS